MKRSLNEVQRICQKAAEGAGAPAGLDSDAAHGATWLLVRDLPALADLAQDLTRFPGLAAACRFERGRFGGRDRVVDAADKAGAVIAPLLVDLLVARAGLDGEPGRLRVSSFTAPLFLLPPAVRYAAEGWRFRLDLVDGADQRIVINFLAEEGVDILGPDSDMTGVLFREQRAWSLDAVCARSPALLNGRSQTEGTVVLDAERLAAAAARSLAEGVSPDPQAWDRLQILAAKVLVPATAQSHRRGAGALASDNE